MKTRLFPPTAAISVTIALLLFRAGPVCAEAEDRIAKSFEVAAGGQLVVEADRGSIDVQTAETGTVQIEITRVAKGSESKARKILEDHVITFSQNGNRVMVNAEHTGPKTTGWFGNSPQLEVRYQITVPRKFEADLKTAGGHIEVRALIGKLQARTSGGNISLTGCKGPVDVHTSGGSLNLTAIEGDTTARTSGGSIRASKLTGKSVVKTSGGSITLALGPKVAADVDLHTSAGHVSTALPVVSSIQGKPDKNALRGKVNGGGPLLTAHTSGGSVRLEKR